MYAFSNATNFGANRAYSVAASYTNGPLKLAGAYLQMNGTKADERERRDRCGRSEEPEGGWSIGSDRMRSYGGGISYGSARPPSASSIRVRSTTTRVRSARPVAFNNYDVNVRYAVTPAVVSARPTCTRTPACRTPTASTAAIRNGIDLQAVYKLSRRTDVYAEAMYQHAAGRGYQAFINGSGGASSTANQIVGTIGMRTRF